MLKKLAFAGVRSGARQPLALVVAGALLCAFAAPALAGSTQVVTVSSGAFTDLGAGSALIQNLSPSAVLVCEADSLPSPSSSCHVLEGKPVPYPFPTSSHLYAQAVSGSAKIAVSPLQAALVQDSQNAGYQGAVAMTVGTTYAAQRSVKANCTAIGNVSLTLADGSTDVWIISAAGSTVIPYAATAINSSGTTATCTYANLK